MSERTSPHTCAGWMCRSVCSPASAFSSWPCRRSTGWCSWPRARWMWRVLRRSWLIVRAVRRAGRCSPWSSGWGRRSPRSCSSAGCCVTRSGSRWGSAVGVVGSSALFAATHFQLVQFVGLVRGRSRLGAAGAAVGSAGSGCGEPHGVQPVDGGAAVPGVTVAQVGASSSSSACAELRFVGDVVPALGDDAVAADEEHPGFVAAAAVGAVREDPLGRGLGHHGFLVVVPDLQVHEVDHLRVALAELVDRFGDRAAEPADAVGRGRHDDHGGSSAVDGVRDRHRVQLGVGDLAVCGPAVDRGEFDAGFAREPVRRSWGGAPWRGHDAFGEDVECVGRAGRHAVELDGGGDLPVAGAREHHRVGLVGAGAVTGLGDVGSVGGFSGVEPGDGHVGRLDVLDRRRLRRRRRSRSRA